MITTVCLTREGQNVAQTEGNDPQKRKAKLLREVDGGEYMPATVTSFKFRFLI